MTEKRSITPDIESDILKYMEEWKTGCYGDKFTWAKLANATGFSRQALQANHRIKAGYDDVKQLLKGSGTEINALADLEKEVAALRSENSKLKKQNEAYRQKYVRWQENAAERGISVDVLNKPLLPSFKETMRHKDAED
ncbi:MAG: protein kinase [Shewanella sp.]|nr:protein kinase [Shewanella sp.]